MVDQSFAVDQWTPEDAPPDYRELLPLQLGNNWSLTALENLRLGCCKVLRQAARRSRITRVTTGFMSLTFFSAAYRSTASKTWKRSLSSRDHKGLRIAAWLALHLLEKNSALDAPEKHKVGDRWNIDAGGQ